MILWAITILSLIGVVLNILKKRSCFLIWAISNITWTITDFKKGIPEQGYLFAIYTLLSIWGYFKWKKAENERT